MKNQGASFWVRCYTIPRNALVMKMKGKTMYEDNEFLTELDKGYIGHTKPKLRFEPDPYLDVPTWVIRKFEKLARQEHLSLEQYLDKYNPDLNPNNWDNDPGSADQAWA